MPSSTPVEKKRKEKKRREEKKKKRKVTSSLVPSKVCGVFDWPKSAVCRYSFLCIYHTYSMYIQIHKIRSQCFTLYDNENRRKAVSIMYRPTANGDVAPSLHNYVFPFTIVPAIWREFSSHKKGSRCI